MKAKKAKIWAHLDQDAYEATVCVYAIEPKEFDPHRHEWGRDCVFVCLDAFERIFGKLPPYPELREFEITSKVVCDWIPNG